MSESRAQPGTAHAPGPRVRAGSLAGSPGASGLPVAGLDGAFPAAPGRGKAANGAPMAQGPAQAPGGPLSGTGSVTVAGWPLTGPGCQRPAPSHVRCGLHIGAYVGVGQLGAHVRRTAKAAPPLLEHSGWQATA
jgi:hypothetical protein